MRRAARADRSVTAGDHRLEYEKRVNRVVDHVHAHLAEELSLPALARIAAFSPFHFHKLADVVGTLQVPAGILLTAGSLRG